MVNAILNISIIIAFLGIDILYATEKEQEKSNITSPYQLFTLGAMEGEEDFMTLEELSVSKYARIPRGIIVLNRKAYAIDSIYEWVITTHHHLDPLRNLVSAHDQKRIIYYKEAYDFALAEKISLNQSNLMKPRLLALLKRITLKQAVLPHREALLRFARFLHYLLDFDDYRDLLFTCSSEQAAKWLYDQPVNTAIFRTSSSVADSENEKNIVFSFRGFDRIHKTLLTHTYGRGTIIRNGSVQDGLVPGRFYASMLSLLGAGNPVLGLERILYGFRLRLP